MSTSNSNATMRSWLRKAAVFALVRGAATAASTVLIDVAAGWLRAR